MILAFPFARPNPPAVELCGGETIAPLSRSTDLEPDPLVVPRTVFLAISAVVCVCTKISIFTHGLTYLDDHEPEKGAFFYGILISIQLSLGLSGQDVLIPGAVRDDWWVAQICLSMLTLMFAILFALFPKRKLKDEENEERDGDGFFPSVGRILGSKYLILQLGAVGAISAALYSFNYYESEWIHARYHVETEREDLRSPNTAAKFFRPLVIIFFVLIFRTHFSSPRSTGPKPNTASRVGGITAILVAIFFVVLAFMSCDTGAVAGMETGEFVNPECSSQCGCNSERYRFAPVCALDTTTTYFSPCQAGCSEYENLNSFLLFNNCTCSAGHTVRGACALPTCQLVYALYQVFYTVILAISGASLLMQGMVFLRAVQRRDKPVAIGVLMASVGLLANVLGHLLYMLISHLTCAFSVEGVCRFHQPSVYSMALVSAAFCLCSAIVSIIAGKVAVANKAVQIQALNGGEDLS
ncbi:hypothetical protein ABMA27_007737 [Loxostege sticticalis]|uniref:Kazal-like domain-containing protein n=1 Tax=Loxostege sticticalis TaxID=481309 RepID=A0ABR3HD22_LOXSC